MVNFSWNRASDYRTIWIPDELVRSTKSGGQNGYHLKTGPVFRWLKQDGSWKCFSYLKTGPVFMWSTFWNWASDYQYIWISDLNLFGIQMVLVFRCLVFRSPLYSYAGIISIYIDNISPRWLISRDVVKLSVFINYLFSHLLLSVCLSLSVSFSIPPFTACLFWSILLMSANHLHLQYSIID
jgi:hypothetical protein